MRAYSGYSSVSPATAASVASDVIHEMCGPVAPFADEDQAVRFVLRAVDDMRKDREMMSTETAHLRVEREEDGFAIFVRVGTVEE